MGIDDSGKVVPDRAVENDPAELDDLVALRAPDGVDVVGSFAGFLEAVRLAEGLALVHAPGIAVNRAGQGFGGGERKSDPGTPAPSPTWSGPAICAPVCRTTARAWRTGSSSDAAAT